MKLKRRNDEPDEPIISTSECWAGLRLVQEILGMSGFTRRRAGRGSQESVGILILHRSAPNNITNPTETQKTERPGLLCTRPSRLALCRPSALTESTEVSSNLLRV